MNYFTPKELECQHCGDDGIKPEFLDWLNALRFKFGKPMVITSGYRCKDHPIEARKQKPGAHESGYAVDVAVSGEDAIELISLAYDQGCKRIGVNANTFVHIDIAPDKPNALWTY